jgi:hypothetical protein
MKPHAHLEPLKPDMHGNQLVARLLEDVYRHRKKRQFLFLQNTLCAFDRSPSFSWN